MLKRFCALAALFAFGLCAYATQSDKKSAFDGCSGGMMLHAGYVFAPDNHLLSDPHGVVLGLGGTAKVHLVRHLRLGAEGYVSNLFSGTMTEHSEVLQKGSFVRTSFGGLLADAYWRCGKVWPFIGAGFGGGARRSFYLYSGSQDDFAPEENAVFRRVPFFYVDPYVGVEYCFRQRVHFLFRADWQLAFHQSQLLEPTGPKLSFGFIFCH